ncbi:MAG: hypothetical protein Q8L07_03190 [Sediminibacterium sp.]|nr:hypothetical protein [Sediminibacterium sp.]
MAIIAGTGKQGVTAFKQLLVLLFDGIAYAINSWVDHSYCFGFRSFCIELLDII